MVGKVVPLRRPRLGRKPSWKAVTLALVVFGVGVTLRFSPAFPDSDFIRYGLFVPGYDVNELVIEHCETHGGRSERVSTRVNCYGEGRTLWWSMEVGSE